MSRAVEEAHAWLAAGRRVALVTVIEADGSTPRPTGPAMAIRDDGVVTGSLSAGCVDGEAYALAEEVLATGRTARRTYGGPQVSSNGTGTTELPPDLADLGPTILCGGTMTIEVRSLTQADRCELERSLARHRADMPLLIVYGANDVAAELCRLGVVLGRSVTVVDPRPVFTTPERFPEASSVVVARPEQHLQALLADRVVDETTAVVMLSHDATLDVPLLALALKGPVGHVAALGSRATQRKRIARLRDTGLTDAQVARLRGPAGLDLGGISPAEIALSILAEIVAVANGGTGAPLARTGRAIHRDESQAGRSVPSILGTDVASR